MPTRMWTQYRCMQGRMTRLTPECLRTRRGRIHSESHMPATGGSIQNCPVHLCAIRGTRPARRWAHGRSYSAGGGLTRSQEGRHTFSQLSLCIPVRLTVTPAALGTGACFCSSLRGCMGSVARGRCLRRSGWRAQGKGHVCEGPHGPTQGHGDTEQAFSCLSYREGACVCSASVSGRAGVYAPLRPSCRWFDRDAQHPSR